MTAGTGPDSVTTGRERLFELEKGLHQLYRRGDMTDAQRETLLDALNHVAWDDAIHIAAPWEPRSSLCGNWFRNLVTLDGERPDGMSGCWTCLMAAEWWRQGDHVFGAEGGGVSDWTVNPETNRSNDSREFHQLVTEVAKLIRGSAHALIGGDAPGVALLIVSQLAHKHGLAPTSGPEGGDE